MPDITKVDLSRYRFRKAEEMLVSARRDMEAKDYVSANNRAHYAIFHWFWMVRTSKSTWR